MSRLSAAVLALGLNACEFDSEPDWSQNGVLPILPPPKEQTDPCLREATSTRTRDTALYACSEDTVEIEACLDDKTQKIQKELILCTGEATHVCEWHVSDGGRFRIACD